MCQIDVSVYEEQSGNYSSPLSAADAVFHETIGRLLREQNSLIFIYFF